MAGLGTVWLFFPITITITTTTTTMLLLRKLHLSEAKKNSPDENLVH